MDGQYLFDLLGSHHDKKLGYVIYRCTYGDDNKWARFIERLTDHVNAALDYLGADGDLIRDCWAWDIREEPTELDGASKADICRRFNDWVASVDGSTILAKYACCIYADAEVVDAVLDAHDPKTSRASRDEGPRPFVKLINYHLCEIVEQQASEQASEKKGPRARMIRDGGYEYVDGAYLYVDPVYEHADRRDESVSGGCGPVDGCNCHDVGWQKLAPRVLLPRAYALLCDDAWEDYYKRPPVINDE